MFDASDARPESPAPGWPKWLLRALWMWVTACLSWLALTTALRIAFPWDLYVWPESPFMTNMLKLDRGQPLFSAPDAANSFVYSPGLDYLTFAVLHPFGLHLDIRCCRLVNVLIGITAGAVAGLATHRALRSLVPRWASGRFALLGAGVAVLVIFSNFTADVTHPDNLVALHTVGVFLLTITAVESGSFALAVATMVFTGLGVFAKQILMGAFVGPALLFWCFGSWGARKSGLLAALGALATLGAVAVLWAPPFARFYTFQVLAHQGVSPSRFYWILIDSLHGSRALLWFLGLVGLTVLWAAGPAGRRFIVVWATIGACSVWPNALSYLKQMGSWNNLIIFQFWLLLLAWPAVGLWLHQRAATSGDTSRGDGRLDFVLGSLVLGLVLLLVPTHLPPHRSMYACCAAVQDRVTADLKAGLKVLVSHGTMYQLRAGSRQVPLDRANSDLELRMAGLGGLAGTAGRIHTRYYDRIYLVLEDWYEPAVLAEIEQNYTLDSVVKRPLISDRIELGRYLPLMGDCKILSPLRPASVAAPDRSSAVGP